MSEENTIVLKKAHVSKLLRESKIERYNIQISGASTVIFNCCRSVSMYSLNYKRNRLLNFLEFLKRPCENGIILLF